MIKETFQRKTKNIWFPKQREPNRVTEPDLFLAYWQREKERLIDGFYLADGQVYISGWLYWHTVYWTIEKNIEVKGKAYKTTGIPDFRDIDWEMALNKEKAEQAGEIIELVGARGFGKSVWDGSIGGYYYTLFDDVEICISGAHNTDIRVVTDKIEVGLTNIHPVFKKQRLSSNWKSTVRAGFKDKKTGQPSDNSSNSRFEMRNYKQGNDSMACNGLRPKFHVIDEIGKIKNLKACVSDTVPCWINPDTGKYLAVVVLSGTGGDMEVGQDAGEMFFEPWSWNILQFDDIWEGRGKIGWFMPATKAIGKYKEPKKLSEYLGIQHSDLDHITILVSNEEKCLEEFVKPRRLIAEKAGLSAMIKEKAYYPIKPSESFLVISQNPFNVDQAKAQQLRIKEKGLTGIPIEIYHDGDKLVHKFTNKKPVDRFPVRSGDDITGCIVMIEPPLVGSPWGLYTAGIDPYNQSKSSNSDSLGACYIFKRVHNITGEGYQDMIVAYYVGRPDDQFEWYENVRKMLKYYNATALVENENPGFIQYMALKGDGHYLRDQPEWLKDIHANSSVKRDKGLHVTDKIRDYLNDHLKKYLNDTAYILTDEEGNKKEFLGVHKVLDPMLLEEIIKYNATGNFDRVVAVSLAIAYANELNQKMKEAVEEDHDVYKSYFQKIQTNKKYMFNEVRQNRTTRSKNKIFL